MKFYQDYFDWTCRRLQPHSLRPGGTVCVNSSSQGAEQEVHGQGSVHCPILWAGSAITFSPLAVADSETAAIGNIFSQVHV